MRGVGFARLALLLPVVSYLPAQNTPAPSISVSTAATPIKLDGLLDDPAWKDAAAAELTQQSPRPGAVTSYRTAVRVVIQDNKLFFGFECADPDPRLIAVH